MASTFFIKNMVCARCIMVVKETLKQLNIDAEKVELGVVETSHSLNEVDKKQLSENLNRLGFEIIEDKKIRTVERVKNLIIEMVHHTKSQLKGNLSEYLSRELLRDYSLLSSLFSEIENTTIEKYFILQKIEKVKELLVYDELTLSEIAERLHYSSVAHLSSQFKNVTGMTPTEFKKIKGSKRKQIENI